MGKISQVSHLSTERSKIASIIIPSTFCIPSWLFIFWAYLLFWASALFRLLSFSFQSLFTVEAFSEITEFIDLSCFAKEFVLLLPEREE